MGAGVSYHSCVIRDHLQSGGHSVFAGPMDRFHDNSSGIDLVAGADLSLE